MILLGLSGSAGSGKSAVAEYLVKRYGFLRFSFSDALYREVTEAFGLEDESLLRDRVTKEVPSDLLAIKNCADDDFSVCVYRHLHGRIAPNAPLSPRQILQWWGTEYRRATDPDYWIKAAQAWMLTTMHAAPYAELRQTLFVNDSVRFPNEREWVQGFSPFGSIWHIHRDAATPVHAHESETPLPVLDGERQIWNNGGLHHLHQAVDLLLSSTTPTVRCEPMKKITDPEEQV